MSTPNVNAPKPNTPKQKQPPPSERDQPKRSAPKAPPRPPAQSQLDQERAEGEGMVNPRPSEP